MPASTRIALPVEQIEIDDCWRRIGVRGDKSCPQLEQHLHCRNCPTYRKIARRLLDRAAPSAYRGEWPDDAGRAAVVSTDDEAPQSAVLFRLGNEWLALPAGIFHEVAESRPVHSLPHRRNSAVLGIANVRGELLICLSLAELLGIDEAKEEEQGRRAKIFRRLVVVGERDKRVAFTVDEVHGLHRYRARDTLAVPATIGKTLSAATVAVLPWRERAVGCLDPGQLLTMMDRSMA
ncbi:MULTISPECIES: chemotaxis protein CheW [unclassified Mesorhizobium]|uniref:chemotaxis protein CheW n=1 Tax=unclassified Mesorhizobium TaxID=325217 RepID=UPI001126F466|nr:MULTISPECIES: chemotaxis protein CheW [unclassified Mesorhizobium]MCA0056597.1 chemotaxis protein CheW [Mesorhizobium sp. B261B1A]TPL02643.1 purine-binding chemotaxis protein CheW [Mesorhizobium sp. B2-4-11]